MMLCRVPLFCIFVTRLFLGLKAYGFLPFYSIPFLSSLSALDVPSYAFAWRSTISARNLPHLKRAARAARHDGTSARASHLSA